MSTINNNTINNNSIDLLEKLNGQYSRQFDLLSRVQTQLGKTMNGMENLGVAVENLCKRIGTLPTERIPVENIEQIQETKQGKNAVQEQTHDMGVSSSTLETFQTIQKVIESIEGTAGKISTIVETINKTVTGIPSSTETIKSDCENVQKSVQEVGEKVLSVVQSVGMVTESITILQTECETVYTSFSSINTSVVTVTNSMEEVISTSQEINSTLEKVDSTCQGLHSGVDYFEQSSTQAQTTFRRIEETATRVETRLEQVRQTTNQVSNSFSTANSTSADLSESMTKVASKCGESNAALEKVNENVDDLKSKDAGNIFSKIGESIKSVLNPAELFQKAVGNIKEFIGGSLSVWKEYANVEGELEKAMRKTLQAGQDELAIVTDLTAAQQKMGVVSQNVQMAGATELAGYVNKTEELSRLLPLMNDLIASEHGVNAEQKDAAAMATLMGKALKGEVDGIKNCGVTFSAAQEEIMKFGSEAERTAVLAEAMESAVGGVNSALGNTPEGKFSQHANSLQTLQARIGSLYDEVMISLMPIFDTVSQALDGVINLFDKHKGTISSILNTISTTFNKALSGISVVIGGVISVFGWLYDRIAEGNPLMLGVLGILGVMAFNFGAASAQALLLATCTSVVTTAQTLWTAAQAAFNAVAAMNPISLIIMGIIAMISFIAYVCTKIQGWGSLWEGVVGFMENMFYAFVEGVKHYFNTFTSTILNGLDTVIMAWYRFRKRCGLGDSDENESVINEISGRIEARAQAMVEGAEKVKEYTQKAADSLSGISMSWGSDTHDTAESDSVTTTDGVPEINSTSGVPRFGAPAGLENVGADGLSGKGVSGQNMLTQGYDSGINFTTNNTATAETSNMVSSISSGVSSGKSVTIQLGNMIENLIFNGEFETNREDMQKEIENALMNVLQMANSAQ